MVSTRRTTKGTPIRGAAFCNLVVGTDKFAFIVSSALRLNEKISFTMACNSHILAVIVLLLNTLTPLFAFETVTGAFRTASSLGALRRRNQEEEEPERRKQSSRYANHKDIDVESILRPLFSSKTVLWEPVETFSLDEDDECYGDDCDEDCLIPEEFSKTDFDVMAYLGVRRAEPLRISNERESVWE